MRAALTLLMPLLASARAGGRAPGTGNAAPAPARQVGRDVQLFLDDELIDSSGGLVRSVQHPVRLPEPVLDHKRFGTNSPWLTVLRDAGTGRFRIWYDTVDDIHYAESSDGVVWEAPRLLLSFPRHTYGAAVLDDGPRERDASRRFKLACWQNTRALAGKPQDDAGMWVAFSPDGSNWAPLTGNPLVEFFPALRYAPEAGARIVRHSAGDIIDPFYDPARGRYGVALKSYSVDEDHYRPAPRGPERRLVSMSTSADFVHWEKPWRILWPDAKDEGLLEFYGMGGIHAVGSLLVGFARVLRDDLPREPGGPADGIGYTVLAWSRDGQTWHRNREPFLDRNPRPGTWDRAMSWITSVVPVGDEIFFYYGGYALGHKVGAGTGGRQIGLARGLRRDRYVARSAGDSPGWLVTPPLAFRAGRLLINVEPRAGGSVRVGLLDAGGRVVPGFEAAACDPIRSDSLAAAVSWRGQSDLSRFAGKAIRLRFELRSADLFAFRFTE
jgi:hypothetical protein